MADPLRCCILEVCCTPGTAEHTAALANYMRRELGRAAEALEAGEYAGALDKLAAKMLSEFRFKGR